MLNRAPPSLQQIIGRVPAVAKFGIRLYLVLAVVQFVAGFVVGGALVLFDYDLDVIQSFLPAGG